ncbi:type I restriction-modification system subunit M N-terminal domain-containing protein, partial [Candidatus Thiothrix sp. Deng01]
MNQKQIKQLETELWDSANTLRATSKLTAAEYKDPVLGLILLRYAQNRFEQARERVEKNLPPLAPGRTRKESGKEQFKAEGAIFIPETARYEYLANLPEGETISSAVNEAMRLIEAENPELAGVLPKNYQEMGDQERGDALLRELIRVFNKDSVKKLTGDVFGRIYEFFLMKFSMDGAGAQEGGEFFTPPALVQLIVNLIQPDHGIIHDPACGSGGMFVQTGHFLEENRNIKSINAAIKC